MNQLTLLRIATDLACRDAFFRALEDGRWHLRRDLCREINGLTERQCRLIAEGSQGRVIGSAKGYRLTRFASVDEIDHAERQLVSQANKMKARALEIRICRNRAS